jgi:hypothetical protein
MATVNVWAKTDYHKITVVLFCHCTSWNEPLIVFSAIGFKVNSFKYEPQFYDDDNNSRSNNRNNNKEQQEQWMSAALWISLSPTSKCEGIKCEERFRTNTSCHPQKEADGWEITIRGKHFSPPSPHGTSETLSLLVTTSLLTIMWKLQHGCFNVNGDSCVLKRIKAFHFFLGPKRNNILLKMITECALTHFTV